MHTSDNLQPDVFSRACTSRDALHHLTGRWGSLVMVALHTENQPMRFNQIRKRIEGISDKMLSQTLTQLERDGMVERTVLSAIPPHVDYSLTPLGMKIAVPLMELTRIIEEKLPSVIKAQQEFDEHGSI